MKVIIPAAGLGKRLRPNTLSMPKPLLRVGEKRIIDYVISSLSSLSYDEIIFITGYMHNEIEQYISTSYSFPMQFVIQDAMRGLADAVYLGLERVRPDDDIIVLLSDTIISADFTFSIKSRCNYIGVMGVDDPSRFGIVTCNGENILSMTEKPDNPPSNLAIAGIYYFQRAGDIKETIEYLYENNVKHNNEYQLTDAMKRMMDRGACFRTMHIKRWIDCGTHEMLLKANEMLGSSTVSAGRDVKIIDSEVENSIIDDSTIIENSHIENSVIGKHCRISNFTGTVYAGDYTVIEKEDK